MRRLPIRSLSAALAVILLFSLISVGSAASSSDASDGLLAVDAISHMEPTYDPVSGTDVVGVGFRYTLLSSGVGMGANCRTVLTNATVDPTGAGVRYPLLGMGAVVTNKATVGADASRLVRGGEGVADVAAERLYGVKSNGAEYAVRIVNIPLKYAETAVYARPYYVYLAGEEAVTVYGDIHTANSSGQKMKYSVEPADLNWRAGTLDEQNGEEKPSETAIYSDYIDHGDLMIRLPEDGTGAPTATAQVFYYGAAGLLKTVHVNTAWTVLSDLGIPEGTQAARIVIRPIDGQKQVDVTALAETVTVTASRQVGVIPLTFAAGSISVWDGTDIDDDDHNRTGYLTIRDAMIAPEKGSYFAALFYDEKKAYMGCTNGYTERARKLLDIAPAGAVYVRFIISGEEDEIASPVYLNRLNAYYAGCADYRRFTQEAAIQEPSVLTADMPAHQGMQNALWNMEQLTNITYTPKAPVPQKVRDYPADVKHKGMVYSSTRIEQTYVPNNVSFHTFMTAVQNPNSYLYTVDLERDYKNKNGKTYYGAVCSTACAHSLNIIPNYTTHQWAEIPGMEVLEQQDMQQLELCDTIVGDGHVAMITEILRDFFGRVVQVKVSEAAGSDVHSTKYTVSALLERFPLNVYTICRYGRLAEVTYTPSEYVAVGEENAKNVTYDGILIPRKGDMANWRAEETVILDIIKPGAFTHFELYKDGELLEARIIDPYISVIELTEAIYHTPGQYKARLLDEVGGEHSGWCQWYVTDATSRAELYQDTRHVKVSFSATNAEPLYVQWMDGASNGTIHVTVLTEQHLADGYGIFAPATGKIKARVAFRTPFGIVYAALPEAITVKK